MKNLLMLLALASSAFASGGESLVGTWVGVASLIIFVIGYYVIAAEEVYHINKIMDESYSLNMADIRKIKRLLKDSFKNRVE